MSTLFLKAIELQRRAWALSARTLLLPVGSLFRRVDRHLVWRLSEVCFGAQRPGIYPETSLGNLVTAAIVVTLTNLPNRSYNVTETELLAIASLVRQINAEVVFEIGTADGRTTLNIAQNVAKNGRVFTLNLPLDQDASHRQDVRVGHCFLSNKPSANIVQLWGDSKSFDYEPYSTKCNVVFIDGDHFEPGVTADSQNALRLVDRRNGAILWHDALRYDVQTVLPRLAKSEGLPIYLISGTNLALLCFYGGEPISPLEWVDRQRASDVAQAVEALA